MVKGNFWLKKFFKWLFFGYFFVFYLSIKDCMNIFTIIIDRKVKKTKENSIIEEDLKFELLK